MVVGEGLGERLPRSFQKSGLAALAAGRAVEGTEVFCHRLSSSVGAGRRAAGSAGRARWGSRTPAAADSAAAAARSEAHTSELQSLMRISYAVFCLKKKVEIPDEHY